MTTFTSKSDLVMETGLSGSQTNKRILIGAFVVAFLVIVALAITVGVLANDGDSTGDSNTQTQSRIFTVLECLGQIVNPTDLDKANCILDSYPLIDGYVSQMEPHRIRALFVHIVCSTIFSLYFTLYICDI